MNKLKIRLNFPMFIFLIVVLGILFFFKDMGLMDLSNISGFAILGSEKTKAQVYENTTIDADVYFCPRDNCMDVLISLINNSKKSVHCAFYDLDLKPLIGAMIQGADQNFDLKLVIDDNNYYDNEDKLAELIDYIKLDIPNHQMHNKFCIIDDQYVVTGSFNPTDRGNYKNNNNLIIITGSKYLIENYNTEFDELFAGKFRGGSVSKYSKIYANNMELDSYFCPEDCDPKIISEIIDGAEKSIYFMTFSFTDDSIGDALVDASNRGLEVAGVFEKSQNNKYLEFEKLNNAGINVTWDHNPANMHHKVFVIDEMIVITGSTNPSNNGFTNNDENILIIYDEDIAEKYIMEFESVFG